MPRAIGPRTFAPPMALSQLRGFALLVGRKLLLADDSITIQKIVALTFADEGIEVLAVSNGADAIVKLAEFLPDVVLADVYMPKMSGLQVCEYIKLNEQLKDIPVMLLVGSFEPFDEAEARRVGADDILTKPFQSIRTLVERVGALLGREPASDGHEAVSSKPEESTAVAEAPVAEVPVAEAPVAEAQGAAEFDGAQDVPELVGVATLDGAETMEFPDPEPLHVPAEPMETGQLERTTADTRPLSPEMRAHLQQAPTEDPVSETVAREEKMETHLASEDGPEISEGFGEVLLDLGDFDVAPPMSSDDVILDIDFDSPASELLYTATADDWQSAVAVEAPAASAVVIEDTFDWGAQTEEVVEWEGEIQTSAPEFATPSSVSEEAVTGEVSANDFTAEAAEFNVAAHPLVQEFHEPELLTDFEVLQPAPVTAAATAVAASAPGLITLEQLSPEAVDAIARRAVELLSEKVVQEIAWEVVPQLAELLIKRKLEESN